MTRNAYLPVLGLTLQHQRVLRLVNIIGILLLDALDICLGLDAVVFGESALVTLLHGRVSIDVEWLGDIETYSAGIGQEVWANRLNVAVVGFAQLADGLEVLLASPALGQDREGECNLHICHCFCGGDGDGGGGGQAGGEKVRIRGCPGCGASLPNADPSASPESQPQWTPERVRIL